MSNLEKLIESNAKAIAALSSDIAEMKRDRDYVYDLMADLTNKIANLTVTVFGTESSDPKHVTVIQAQHYETTKNLDRRQDQLTNQQQQLIEILKNLTSS